MAENVKPCRHCKGTGRDSFGTQTFDCAWCGGSGLNIAPKYRVTCELCKEKSPRATGAHTAHKWMTEHNATHRPTKAEE